MNYAISVSSRGGRLIKILGVLAKYNPAFLKCLRFVFVEEETATELKSACCEHEIKLLKIFPIESENDRSVEISCYLLELLKTHGIDYLFLFSSTLLKGDILSEYKNRIINFHPSLLPSYKGFFAIDKALNDNAFLLGNTAHIINDKPDSGHIIMQSIIPRVLYKDYDDVLDMQVVMFIQILAWIDQERLIIKDDVALIQNASYNTSVYIPNIEINYLKKHE